MSHSFKDRHNIKHTGWKDKKYYKRGHINRQQLYKEHYYFDD